jgi:sugar phosphate isomerase/epimerase
LNRDKKSKIEPLYRIGCTSYCFPDDILPNIKTAAPRVDDIEILLFESDNSLEFKNLDIIDDLKLLAKIHNLSYTIHFPLDTPINYGKKANNTFYLNQITEIIGKTEELSPFAYILHLDGISSHSSRSEINAWREGCVNFCSSIAALPNIENEKICLENLKYPLEWFLDFCEMFGFSLCMDLGHLWIQEDNWEDLINQCLPSIRVVHLHGVKNGKDHLSLKKNNTKNLVRFVSLIENKFSGVLTLEIFSLEDLLESLDIIKRIQSNKESYIEYGI